MHSLNANYDKEDLKNKIVYQKNKSGTQIGLAVRYAYNQIFKVAKLVLYILSVTIAYKI